MKLLVRWAGPNSVFYSLTLATLGNFPARSSSSLPVNPPGVLRGCWWEGMKVPATAEHHGSPTSVSITPRHQPHPWSITVVAVECEVTRKTRYGGRHVLILLALWNVFPCWRRGDNRHPFPSSGSPVSCRRGLIIRPAAICQLCVIFPSSGSSVSCRPRLIIRPAAICQLCVIFPPPDVKWRIHAISPGLSCVGVVLVAAVSRQVFSGVSGFSRPFMLASLCPHPLSTCCWVFITNREIWAALNNEVLRPEEGEMRREWSSSGMQGRGEKVGPRENPPTSGIARHDSRMRKSGYSEIDLLTNSQCDNRTEHPPRRRHRGANPRPTDYKSATLPLSYEGRGSQPCDSKSGTLPLSYGEYTGLGLMFRLQGVQRYAIPTPHRTYTRNALDQRASLPSSRFPVYAVRVYDCSPYMSFLGDFHWLCSRAIVSPRNDTVNETNNLIIQRVPGQVKTYKSIDTMLTMSSTFLKIF
ncbi:hypothetical protein PR048_032825 [Dryococelus australis]|uniref:Uncharacterized protein n=1 Tax=Dryococelus australis TaxID=614101 RepID=A0ABQ9G3B1_9NEOP|nr:hypothetical protein PR048_032825 [Dryococelus australis]